MKTTVAIALLLCSTAMFAQKKKQDLAGYDLAARATVLHTANVYVTADGGTSPMTQVTPGHEVVVVARNGAWVNVFANTDSADKADPDAAPEIEDPGVHPDPSTGWIRDKGIVSPGTPNGDNILYGAALEFEAQAMLPHPPKGAAAAAHWLYQRVADYFPRSPLAAEAAYRSADIRWQLDKTDISTLPSAHEQEAYLRPQLFEGDLKRVMKQYPNSPQAAKAAFDLIDNKLCGDWQGLPKCPEMEAGLYIKYANQFPLGPKTAEALYNAAYRQGVLVTMYTVDEQTRRAEQAKHDCQEIADQLSKAFPQSEYAARAQSLAFRVAQNIPIYGSDRD
ncbi:outer membrane protein assembly factor BamD [Granulicella cerasi]|uniref:Outer membrane protein assembly factor BamD n=1 Tax=Granulicella cerasi TaxID=741063 RepID=A0ABW1ZDH3_9BACT|nr:outer membrane protein assembly factor BamD [Granulicella cerasi]